MTVKKLIMKLMEMPEDMEVILYSEREESAGEVYAVDVETTERPDDMVYCKGDHPFDYDPDTYERNNGYKEAVIIKGD